MIRTSLALLFITTILLPARAQTVAAGEAEVARCLERIASVRREMVGKYADSLAELQAQFQKAADLEGALAVRAERQRVEKEGSLSSKDLAPEPRALRTVQQQTLAKIEELVAALVAESVPRLVELKKALTIAGKLDDAVVVREQIARLQNDHLRVARPDAAEIVPAETLLTAYAADRARADKTYKGAKITVRGVVGAFRPDPEGKGYLVYLTKGGNGGWIACHFAGGSRFREEKQFNTTFLVITERDGSVSARIQSGQTLDVAGQCEGFDDVVKLAKCELAR
jgi:hypothetical protein